MQGKERLADDQKLMHTLTIRWRGSEASTVKQISWERHTSASAMIRSIVLQALGDKMKGGQAQVV